MSGELNVYVEGIGVWTPTLPDWPHFRALLRGAGGEQPAAAKPVPALLAPADRRRVPTSVQMAIEAAAQAVAMSGLDAATLPSVFVSAHGDGPVLDYMCTILATTPTEMSPTRFHNSVHNVAAGYWTIATGCRAGSSASSALESSFGAGLLEVASQVVADQRAVLFVASDVAGSGPLAEVIASKAPFACALVLAPQRGSASVARLALSLQETNTASTAQHPLAARLAANNVAANGLPLLESLAGLQPADLILRAANGLGLGVHMEMIA